MSVNTWQAINTWTAGSTPVEKAISIDWSMLNAVSSSTQIDWDLSAAQTLIVTVNDLMTLSSSPVITGTCDVDNSVIDLDIDAGAAGIDSFSYYALGDWSIPTLNPFEIAPTVVKAKDTGGVRPGNTYNIEPHIVKCHNGDYLLIYGTGTSHISKEDIIVSKRSTDGLQTWGAETLVLDNPDYIAENAGVRVSGVGVNPDNGRIIMWALMRGDVATDFTTVRMGYISSTDHGVTWSAFTDVYPDFAGYPSTYPIGAPNSSPDLIVFSQICKTSLGLVMPMYAINKAAYLLVSTDGGETWPESNTILIDNYDGVAQINETHIVQIDQDRLVIVARNDAQDNQFCFWKSSDGGTTWTARSAFITYTALSLPAGAAPIKVQKIGTEIHSWFCARVDAADSRPPKIYKTRVGAESFWADPGIAFRVSETYDNHRTERNGVISTHYLNCGYPDIAPIDAHPYTSVAVYYDQNPSGLEDETDILIETFQRLEV